MKSHQQSFTDGTTQQQCTPKNSTIKSAPQRKKNANCGPTRVQARRQGKVGEAGYYHEEKLIKRLVVHEKITASNTCSQLKSIR
jgi:hypothetical protein